MTARTPFTNLRTRKPKSARLEVQMSLNDQEVFARALISPAKPNAALKRAFAKAKRLITISSQS
jgi:hypothetical protein